VALPNKLAGHEPLASRRPRSWLRSVPNEQSDHHEAQRGGDDTAALYAAHRIRLVRLAVLLVDDLQTAEDVVQDAFAGYVAHPRSLTDPTKALGHLRTAVVNNARSALRRRKTFRAYVAPREAEPEQPDRRLLLADEHREVLDAMARLSTRQREVLVLRYWSELSETEISQVLGVSRGTVKSTASRALDTLEKVMEESR